MVCLGFITELEEKSFIGLLQLRNISNFSQFSEWLFLCGFKYTSFLLNFFDLRIMNTVVVIFFQ